MSNEPALQSTAKAPAGQEDWRSKPESVASGRVEFISFSIGEEQYGVDIMAVREIMDGMIVRVAQETYVMPISAIVECIRPARTDIRPLVGTCGALQIRGSIVPLVYLGDVFDVPGFARDPAECTVIVIEGSDRARLGLVVDELCGHQQVVIKSIEENYGSVPGIAAATILGNGRVAFIVDIEKLSDLLDAESRPAAAARTSQAA